MTDPTQTLAISGQAGYNYLYFFQYQGKYIVSCRKKKGAD